ncbi:MAG: aspartate kinase [Anaerolineae bacterium]|nr:aspartate kinase [Anaerolineae bacterium]
MSTLVMKFGGSSVGRTDALAQVLSVVLHERERWDRLMLVVSALDGVTDVLIEAAHLAQLGNQRGYRRIIANLRTRHLSLIDELPMGSTERAALQADIDRLLFDLLDIYHAMPQASGGRPMTGMVDATVGVGEKLSARIIAALLRQSQIRSVAIDTTSLIVTDDTHGFATPNLPLTRQLIDANLLPLVERGIVPVVTGFIGATSTGQPTTLGRGGSDYTASILGVCVRADEIWIWSDVDGMMTADPRDVPNTRVIPLLDYDEVAEMSYFGARVLHPRMIGPLRAEHIPVRVKNVFKPQQDGTLIKALGKSHTARLKAVTAISGITLSAERSSPTTTLPAMIEMSSPIATSVYADVIIAAQSSTRTLICYLIPTLAGPDALHTMQAALRELAAKVGDPPWEIQIVNIITVVGSNAAQWGSISTHLLDAVGDIPVTASAQGPSGFSFSIVVGGADGEAALQRIHETILNSA